MAIEWEGDVVEQQGSSWRGAVRRKQKAFGSGHS